MEGSGKRFSSPSKSTASPKSSSTGENNENDSSQDTRMNFNFKNHKKVVSKNFMSSTISAASKAAVPRKKILAERNENSNTSDAQNHNTKIRRDSVSCHSLTNSDGSSLKSYDPLTNYLSPRPKYLRFNPNRRKEIFNRLEQEELTDDEVEPASLAEDVKDSSFSPPKESVVSSKNEESSEGKDETVSNGVDDDDDGDEEEEVDDERRWCLKGVLKLLLTLVACILSTSSICSMNSPTPFPTQQAIWDLKDGFLMIKNQTFEVINLKMHESGFLEVGVGDDDFSSEVEGVEIYEGSNGETEEGIEEEIVEGDAEKGVEIYEGSNGETEEGIEEEIVEGDAENVEKHGDYIVENENEDPEDRNDEAAEVEGAGAEEFKFRDENFEQSIAAKDDESIDAGTFGSDPVVGDEYVRKIEVESETESIGRSIIANEDVIEAADEYELEKEVKAHNQLQDIEVSIESNSHEETLDKFKPVDDTESLQELVESHETLNDSEDEVNEIRETTQWNSSAFIGISAAISMVLTSLSIIIHHSKKSRTAPEVKSQPVLKPHMPAETEEILAPEIPTVNRKIEFAARPELLSKSMEEASGRKLSHHIYAPTVELIGEIDVGRVSSHRKTETEEINATTIFPKNRGVEVATQSSAVEYSANNSPSFGSFTTKRKRVLKKEGRQSGEAVIEVTPVRRSSRLRNRAAVVSP